MERARLAFFVAVAFFASAFLAALALSEEAPLAARGRAEAILVSVENVGHDASVTVEAQRASGGQIFLWRWEIPSGGEQTARVANPVEKTIILVRAEWADLGQTARGDARFLVDPADCPRGDLILRVRADTANGVSIEGLRPPECA